jgi:hypothetical protein
MWGDFLKKIDTWYKYFPASGIWINFTVFFNRPVYIQLKEKGVKFELQLNFESTI